MARFTAPADTSGITLSTGFHAVREGILEVPDDLNDGDRLGLAANGFAPAPAAAAPETEPRKAIGAEPSTPAAEAE